LKFTFVPVLLWTASLLYRERRSYNTAQVYIILQAYSAAMFLIHAFFRGYQPTHSRFHHYHTMLLQIILTSDPQILIEVNLHLHILSCNVTTDATVF